jgi:hypothetical protein
MNDFIEVVGKSLGRKIPSIKIPYQLGMFGGYCFDIFAWLTRRKLPIKPKLIQTDSFRYNETT